MLFRLFIFWPGMTEEKEQFRSIFDAASKLERKKAVHKALAEAEEKREAERKAPMTDEELLERFERCKQLHNVLADRMEKAFEESKLTPRMLKDYFDKPQNFTSEQWQIIQKQREVVDQMLAKLVKREEESEKAAAPAEAKSKEKRPTKMQVKSRWIPMR
jgi:hypothetical protein